MYELWIPRRCRRNSQVQPHPSPLAFLAIQYLYREEAHQRHLFVMALVVNSTSAHECRRITPGPPYATSIVAGHRVSAWMSQQVDWHRMTHLASHNLRPLCRHVCRDASQELRLADVGRELH